MKKAFLAGSADGHRHMRFALGSTINSFLFFALVAKCPFTRDLLSEIPLTQDFSIESA
jgi:hypothetical protein